MINTILQSAADLTDSIFDGIDSIVTSDEERQKLKAKVKTRLIDFRAQALKVEEQRVKAREGIISGAQEQPFWRSWRGLVMIGVFILAVVHAVVPSVSYFSAEGLMTLLKWGLGGYIGSEGAIGIARHIAPATAERERRKAEEARRETERERRIREEIRSSVKPGPVTLQEMPAAEVDLPDDPSKLG